MSKRHGGAWEGGAAPSKDLIFDGEEVVERIWGEGWRLLGASPSGVCKVSQESRGAKVRDITRVVTRRRVNYSSIWGHD